MTPEELEEELAERMAMFGRAWAEVFRMARHPEKITIEWRDSTPPTLATKADAVADLRRFQLIDLASEHPEAGEQDDAQEATP